MKIKNIIKHLSFVIIFLIILPTVYSQTDTKKNITILLSIPGGCRSHIINIDQKGELKYFIGENIDLKNFIYDSISINTDYKIKIKQLKEDDRLRIEKITSQISKNEDSNFTILKDTWQYFIFIDNNEFFKGFDEDLNSFPNEIQSLLKLSFDKIKKYNLPGMS